jgi:hypothetical protein
MLQPPRLRGADQLRLMVYDLACRTAELMRMRGGVPRESVLANGDYVGLQGAPGASLNDAPMASRQAGTASGSPSGALLAHALGVRGSLRGRSLVTPVACLQGAGIGRGAGLAPGYLCCSASAARALSSSA